MSSFTWLDDCEACGLEKMIFHRPFALAGARPLNICDDCVEKHRSEQRTVVKSAFKQVLKRG